MLLDLLPAPIPAADWVSWDSSGPSLFDRRFPFPLLVEWGGFFVDPSDISACSSRQSTSCHDE